MVSPYRGHRRNGGGQERYVVDQFQRTRISDQYQGRDTIWINPGFQEQLVLFQLCQYKPHPNDGVYAGWRMKLDRKLRDAGFR